MRRSPRLHDASKVRQKIQVDKNVKKIDKVEKKSKVVSKKVNEKVAIVDSKQDSLSRSWESKWWEKGAKLVAGVDEAGRGPLAGPVVAAACIVPPDVHFSGINDSKQVSEEDRERLYEEITNHPKVIFNICSLSEKVIDDVNILQATMNAMTGAVQGLSAKPNHVFIDGNRVPEVLKENHSVEAVIKGDSKIFSIACASILAKVFRDRIMLEYDKEFPVYGFAKHKGYPTLAHRQAVAEHGPCKIHRMTFGPVKRAIEESSENPAQPEKKKTKSQDTENKNSNTISEEATPAKKKKSKKSTDESTQVKKSTKKTTEESTEMRKTKKSSVEKKKSKKLSK